MNKSLITRGQRNLLARVVAEQQREHKRPVWIRGAQFRVGWQLEKQGFVQRVFETRFGYVATDLGRAYVAQHVNLNHY
jgi:hypothetical protein